MGALTLRLLQMSLHGAALILIAALLRPLLLRILPKGMLRLLWVPVLLALALPLPAVFTLSVPLPPALQTAQLLEETELRGKADPAELGTGELRAADAAGEEEREDSPGSGAFVSPLALVSLIWLAGAGVLGLTILSLYLLELRRMRRAVPLEGGEAEAWLREHRLRRPLRLCLLPGLSGPMTYGILRPVILLPGEPDWADPRTRLALEHEFVHVQRLDAAWKLLMNLLLAAHWFDPAVWLMSALLGRDLELSCDEAVLLRLGGEQRTSFAHMLLDTGRRSILTPYPGLGAGVLRERVYSIMTFRRKGGLRRLLGAVLALGMTVCAFGSLQAGAAGERLYRNGGMTLAAPLEVAELLLVETPALTGEKEEVLFRVYERETREAARELYPDSQKDYGLLLTIERMDEASAGKYLMRTGAGREMLARDALGYYYMLKRCYTEESSMLSLPGTEDPDARWERRKLVNQWVRELRQSVRWSVPLREQYPAHSSAASSWFAQTWYRSRNSSRIGMGEEAYLMTGFPEAEALALRLVWETAAESIRSYDMPEGEPIILTNTTRDKSLWFWEGSDIMLLRSDVADPGSSRRYYTVRMLDAPGQKAGDLVKEWYDAAKAAAGAQAAG